MRYYIYRNEAPEGPFDFDELKHIYEKSDHQSSILCCKEGGSNWILLQEIADQSDPDSQSFDFPALYLCTDGVVTGPFSHPQVILKYKQGSISDETLFCPSDSKSWISFEEAVENCLLDSSEIFLCDIESRFKNLDSTDVNGLLKDGNPAKQIAMLEVLRKRHEKLESGTAAIIIDLLSEANERIQLASLDLLREYKYMPLTAWKLGFELRNREIFEEELGGNGALGISLFKKTPRYEPGQAEKAIEFIRKHLNNDAQLETFETVLSKHTRDEERISEADVPDKLVQCNGCGNRMKLTIVSPHVQLYCKACDITRFEELASVFPKGVHVDNEMVSKIRQLAEYYASGGRSVDNAGLVRDVVQIGEILESRGGLSEMKRIFNLAGQSPGMRTVEMEWNGIGEWRG